MDKTGIRVALILLAVCLVAFACLCLVAFNRPQSAVFALAIASSIVGYVNGWR